MLVRLLSTSSQPTILAITCHDIGQYVKYSGNDGRRYGISIFYIYILIFMLMMLLPRYLQELGAKQKVMELMTHQDPDVRYHALSATQKYFAMVASSSQQ